MEKKKVLLIVNPCAGRNKGRTETFDIVDKFSAADYEFDIKTTTCRGDATNIVKNYIDGNDMVVCCGGDGTFNETINGVMSLQKRVPIGYIPAGSTNDLANTIGLPTDIAKATDVIIEGHSNAYDIGLFNNRFFSYIASFGVGTNFSYDTPQKMKNLLGHSAYIINSFVLHLIPALKSVKPIHIKIEYDGKSLEDDFYFGSISNSTSVAGLFKFNKEDVKLDDGKFELLLVRRLSSPLEAFGLLAQVRKKIYDGNKVMFLRCSSVKMTFDKPTPWTLDGEFGGSPKEVRFSVLNGAIDVISGENPMFTGKPYQAVRQETIPERSPDELKEEKVSKYRRKNKAAKEDSAGDTASDINTDDDIEAQVAGISEAVNKENTENTITDSAADENKAEDNSDN